MSITINGTTGISGVAGSASTPALIGSDADSGYYINSANEPNASVNGTAVWNAASSFGFKNRVINGATSIAQRGTGAITADTSDQFPVDRFKTNGSTSGKYTAQQNAGPVTPPAGFVNYLGTTSSSAYSVPSGEAYSINYIIEGYNIADLGWGAAGAATVTLSFWARSSLTGTFGGVVRNGSGARSYAFTYTISAANTWEFKTITIPGDTTGTWSTNNSGGMVLLWSLACGSTYLGAAGAWAGTTYFGATGQTNVLGTNGATFYITGVQLEKGSTATSFDFRSYGTELALCQRYYEKSYSTDVVPGTATANGCLGLPTGYISGPIFNTISLWYRVEKRSAPSVSYYDVAGTASVVSTYRYSDNVRTDGVSSSITISPSTAGAFFRYTTNVSGAALQWVATSEL